jgi:hypothetical protein
VKIGWNPIYLEPATPFRNTVPDFGVEIECPGGGCNGLPCKIDPAENGVNEVTGSSSDGAGGASFCVVTVPKGSKASIVVFDGSGGSGASSDDDEEEEEEEEEAEETTTTEEPTSTTTTTTSTTTTTTSKSTKTSTTTTTTESSSSTEVISHSSSSHESPSSSGFPDYTYKPHVLVETGDGTAFASETSEPEEASPSPTSGAHQTSQNAMMALFGVIAMAAFTF